MSEATKSSLDRFLEVQFRFAPDVTTSLLELCQPCEAWLDQYRLGSVELVATPEAAVLLTLEAAAIRFLRNKVQPARKGNQKKFLEQVDTHAQALLSLITQYPGIDGTIADPFLFLEKAGRRAGRKQTRTDYFLQTAEVLSMLRLFARARLHKDLKPEPSEEAEEEAKRRTQYPRFVLIADLLSAYKRITGKEPTAYASTESRNGIRRRGEAVAFLSVALPPILKAARLKVQTDLGDQTLRSEIAEVKKHWDNGQFPELAYVFQDWGSRVG